MNPFVAISAFFAAANAQYIAAPYAAPGYYAAGVPVAAPVAPAPVAAPVYAAPAVPYTAPSSQYQAQDEFGNVQHGYSNINSAKTEIGNAYGGVTGSYSYVDPNGDLQRVDYIADGLGFRVKATNLPVAPPTPAFKALEAPVFEGVAPSPVEDTAEVKAAKEEFFAKFEEAKNRQRRSVVAPYAAFPYAYAAPATPVLAPVEADTPAATVKAVHAVATPAVYAHPAPYAYNYAPVAAPALAPAVTYATAPAPAVTYAAPAVAAPAVESTLTTIKLNPGHAVAYRFD